MAEEHPTVTDLRYEGFGAPAVTYDTDLDEAAVSRFAQATGWVETDSGRVPPLFGVVPSRSAVVDAIAMVIPVEVREAVPVLHGEHLLERARPLRPGETIRVSAAPLGVARKASGTVVTFGTDLSVSDELVERHTYVVFLPGWQASTDAGTVDGVQPQVPRDVAPNPIRSLTTADQSRRYASASGDDTAFHVDDAAARSHGFPGVIMHGLCTLAVVTGDLVRAAERSDDELLSLAVRFASPAIPGDPIATSWWPVAGGRRLAFESSAPHGSAVLRSGLLGFA